MICKLPDYPFLWFEGYENVNTFYGKDGEAKNLECRAIAVPDVHPRLFVAENPLLSPFIVTRKKLTLIFRLLFL